MITIISGTNRQGSNTLKVANIYQGILNEMNIENQLLDLRDIPSEAFHPGMYANHHPKLKEIHSKYIEPVDRFVIVMPEYNGGFPGVMKMFIDLTPPSQFNYSKAAIVGVSAGRAGNLRGMDDLTNLLNYLKVSVLFSKPKLSGIDNLLNEDGLFKEKKTKEILTKHAEQFINF